MLKHKWVLLLFVLVQLSMITCQNNQIEKTNKLWFITDLDDLLFMAESTNVLEDSILSHKTQEELVSARLVILKDHGKIYENDSFKIHVLHKYFNKTARNFTFDIRTFDKNNILIDTYSLGIWNPTEDEFCYGWIDENLMIKRKYQNSGVSEIRQILGNGEIGFYGLD